MNDLIQGSGGGGKGGGGSARTAIEAPNNLKSIQYAQVIDLISEGEIGGLVNGANSIFLDDVPLTEFSDATWELRVGTQDQPITTVGLQGTKSTIEVGQPVRKLLQDGSTPGHVTKVIDATYFDAGLGSIDVTIGVPALTYQDMSNGDISGTSVSFQILIAVNNGGYVLVHSPTISGKCTSMYNASYTVPVSIYSRNEYPLSIRVIRVTDDSNKSNLQNQLYWSSYTLNYPVKLSYPNTALVTLSIDSDHFNNIPTRAFEIYGVKVKVPTNYNPTTRAYSGSWDGTFKVAWTDNPAWIYYDLITDTRYGIGDYITEDRIDKWELYTIAKYCDELVSNGYGGTEPRFTCNTYIQTQEDALSILSSLCSIFRGMQYWAGGYFSVSADMPKDPVAEFTGSNVIDGVFNYSGSSLKTRHTAVKVIWNDPVDSYKQKIEYVEANGFVYDQENPDYAFKPLNIYGVVQADMVAVGCTSRGQANRAGKWLLYSELYETETVTFKTGLENATLFPGSIIKTADIFRQGKRMGGRVQSILSNSSMVLDSYEGELTDGYYTLSFVVPFLDTKTNTNKSRIINYNGNINTVNNITVFNSISGDFDPNINENCVWVAAIPKVLESELWRVVSIVQEDEVTATITALEYHPNKFNAIEKGLLLEERPVSQVDYGRPKTPTTNSIGSRPGISDVYYTVTTSLASDINISTTTIPCTSTDSFATSGYLRIGDELLQYTGKTVNSFTGIRRAVNGLIPIAVPHTKNDTIYQATLVSANTAWVNEFLFFQAPKVLGAAASISWSGTYSNYEVKYKQVVAEATTSWIAVNTNVPYIELKPLVEGIYDIQITAINSLGRRSEPLFRTITIQGKKTPPLNITNFVASKSNGGIVLNWDANDSSSIQYPDLDLAGYEIRELYVTSLPSSMVEVNGQVMWSDLVTNDKKNEIWNAAASSKASSGLILSTSYTDISAHANQYNIFLIKAKDDSNNYSALPSIAGVLISPPAIITNINIYVNGSDLVISWDPPKSDVAISHYILSYNDGISSQSIKCTIPEFRQKLWFTGYETFEIISYDIGGNYSVAKSVEIDIGLVPAVNISTPKLSGENYVLNWSTPTTNSTTAPIEFYEIRLDQNWGLDTNLIAKVSGNTFSAKVDWSGLKTFYIAAKDTSGSYGYSASKTIESPTPGAVASLVPTVIDNNVLLSWSMPTAGLELPIVEYEVRKGPTWATSTSIGTKTGLFTTNFETVAGVYTYWVAARNSAKSLGEPKGVTVSVNQPPDYVLATNYFSDFSNKYGTNGSIVSSNTHVGLYKALIIPVNSTETWTSHFTNRGFDQVQDFIDAGNLVYVDPRPVSGYYQEILDLDTFISGSTVTVSLNSTVLSGTPNLLYEISASADNINYSPISNSLINFFTDFRYIKVKITVSMGTVQLNTLNIRIDIKQKTLSGSANAVYSDTGGTIVYLTDNRLSTGIKTFKDVQSINLTPNTGCINSSGTIINTVTAIYDFTDTPDPLTFKILLYNSTNGERLSGTCSYSIRGV